jgi:hypothetical protein
MKPSLRFLALAVFGWAGVRAWCLGALPGAELFEVEPSQAKVPPIAATQFPPIEPMPPSAPLIPAAYAPPPETAPQQSPADIRYVQGVVGVPVSMRPGLVAVYQLPPATRAAEPLPRPARYATLDRDAGDYLQLPPLDQGPLSLLADASLPQRSSVVGRRQSLPAQAVPPLKPGLDRLQLSSWALLRSQQTGIAGSQSLATGGQLGASQAGARRVYNFNRQLALTARASSEVGRRGGVVAAGVRVHPLVNIPLWLTAERRQAIGRYGGGRSAFALFLEGGIYEQPLPWRFSLNGYLQGGVVGLKSRDLFIDGGFAVTRPVYRQFSAGFGIWGGAQPGLYRVDAGPRLTMQVRRNVKVHLDWRQRVAGNARPGSGPALTLAGDF